MTGLGQGIFDKGAKRLFSLANTKLGLAHQFNTQRHQHGLQLGQLALVVRS